jgi:glycosyltransferase involved in cell wall biosynthesis
MPAYNAGRTLRMTYEELPKEHINLVILVDDGSTDDTIEVARALNLEVFVHNRNYGYGAMLIQPILEHKAHLVLGSRLKKGSALQQGMPWWKYASNRFLTRLENLVFGLEHSEYHTGYRAFDRTLLETVNYGMNSDQFIFDQEIIAQTVAAGFTLEEIAVPTRYFPEASQIGFIASSVYGLQILALLFKYSLHKSGIKRMRQFESLGQRYDPSASARTSPRQRS